MARASKSARRPAGKAGGARRARAARSSAPPSPIDPGSARAIAEGDHGEPFSVLGLHRVEGGFVIRTFQPWAESVEAVDPETRRRLAALAPVAGVAGLFAGVVPDRKGPFAYRLRMRRGRDEWEVDDAYRFGPVLGELDEYLAGEGTHRRLWQVLGAHVTTHQGVSGTHFAVWAPGARRVSVVGNFNGWNGRQHPMRRRGSTGIWELFIPGLGEGEYYKYEIKSAEGEILPLKSDPVGFGAEHPPGTASIVRVLGDRRFDDAAWMSRRGAAQAMDAPISIYEVHLGSWRRAAEEDNRRLSYHELADQLVGYAADMGFTHIELLPVTEFPFDGSWGYQPIGLFAPTSRFGGLDGFRAFVEAAHKAGIGVILDWVPGHFPTDEHGLGRFDGTALYEHADPREGFHPDWNTLVYNYGRPEVRNYLIANALYWLLEHHVDGLRVDAVASMLYRDYSRAEGEWVPNVKGGRENLEAIDFLRRMNETVYGEVPGIATFAEESTAWPRVSRPTDQGGLGFGYKWNMGWMNDTLAYMSRDPVHRRHHHNEMTFGTSYAFSENFVLPLSHDEVVHGKRALVEKMPGSPKEKLANLRAYYGFMWTHPGKKLLFMGGELAQHREWNHDHSLDWHLLEEPGNRGVQMLVRDLNRLYAGTPALYRKDCESDGFQWIAADAANESVFAFARFGAPGDSPVVVVNNLTPVPREGWRIGLPAAGRWVEVLNTDAVEYAGFAYGGNGAVDSEAIPWQGQAQSAALKLPPLSTLVFQLAA